MLNNIVDKKQPYVTRFFISAFVCFSLTVSIRTPYNFSYVLFNPLKFANNLFRLTLSSAFFSKFTNAEYKIILL